MCGCEYDPTEMGDPQSWRFRLILWWEALETWRQLSISFPVFAALMLFINIGVFNQPLLRSIFYGLFEGAVLSGMLAGITASERGRRRQSDRRR
jgi:hypothetical protein